jgi:ABC-type phosphate/phosphonate transport system substrate-binding protein
VALALLAVGLVPSLAGAAEQPLVRVGVPRSLFRDIPEPLVRVAVQPFQVLMEAQTGVRGELVVLENAGELAKQLAAGQIQVAVFHGHEFAWMRLQYPSLQPLVIAVNQQAHLQAHIVVGPKSRVASLNDLAGQSVSLPRGNREHCRFFIERQCRDHGKEVDKYFGRIVCHGNAEDALDDVVDGVVEAAVIDSVSLTGYERRKPGRYAKLREVVRSEVFPATAIAYRPGVVADHLVQRFRDGLRGASANPAGRQMLTLWRLTGFEVPSQDYDRLLTAIARTYPPPVAVASVPGQ